MKKLVSVLLALLLTLSLVPALAEDCTIVATPSPHAEILELIKDDLKAAGYDVNVLVVTDYVTENPAVAGGDAIANFFQHIPYLAQYNETAAEGDKLVGVVPTHFEPMAIYAGTKDSLEALTDGDKVAIPNDPTNMTRALLLLQDAGLIKLPEDTTLESVVTKEDIVENEKNLEIIEANAEQIPGLRQDVALAVINGNNAALVELSPTRDGVYAETKDSQAAAAYVNLFAVRPENADSDFVKALEKAVYTQKVYDLIVERGFVPTFTVEDAEAAE